MHGHARAAEQGQSISCYMAPPYDLIGPLARAHVEPLPAGSEEEEEEEEEVVVSALPAELGGGGGKGGIGGVKRLLEEAVRVAKERMESAEEGKEEAVLVVVVVSGSTSDVFWREETKIKANVDTLSKTGGGGGEKGKPVEVDVQHETYCGGGGILWLLRRCNGYREGMVLADGGTRHVCGRAPQGAPMSGHTTGAPTVRWYRWYGGSW